MSLMKLLILLSFNGNASLNNPNINIAFQNHINENPINLGVNILTSLGAFSQVASVAYNISNYYYIYDAPMSAGAVIRLKILRGFLLALALAMAIVHYFGDHKSFKKKLIKINGYETLWKYAIWGFLIRFLEVLAYIFVTIIITSILVKIFKKQNVFKEILLANKFAPLVITGSVILEIITEIYQYNSYKKDFLNKLSVYNPKMNNEFYRTTVV
jgi:hypothetical protein